MSLDPTVAGSQNTVPPAASTPRTAPSSLVTTTRVTRRRGASRQVLGTVTRVPGCTAAKSTPGLSARSSAGRTWNRSLSRSSSDS